MSAAIDFDTVPGSPDYPLLIAQAKSLLADESDPIANAANIAALLYHGMQAVNWVGFYFRQGQQLVLGPFQGKPACVRIPMGKGVCGTAGASKTTQRVDDVYNFDGHIVCDANSRSELVVPLIVLGETIGVLDVDSPLEARFAAKDQKAVESIARIYLRHSRW